MEYTETREEITAKVKDQSDIVQIVGECVELKKSGIRYLGLCPFHGEKTPSFSVHSGQQFFYCFGCGESGDVFSFMMKYYNLDFPNAVKELARRYQIELPERTVSPGEQKQKQLRQLLFEVNKKAARAFSDFLIHSHKSGQARAYLEKRGIPKSIQAKYGLGYAPSVETEGWDFLQKKLSVKEIEAAEIAGLL
ncbi:MAG: DNA primase, partial [Bacteroidetes bacterium]|nr:DNA primase [Bacteroidota bacterium]